MLASVECSWLHYANQLCHRKKGSRVSFSFLVFSLFLSSYSSFPSLNYSFCTISQFIQWAKTDKPSAIGRQTTSFSSSSTGKKVTEKGKGKTTLKLQFKFCSFWKKSKKQDKTSSVEQNRQIISLASFLASWCVIVAAYGNDSHILSPA